jgi:hypothetical protein
MAPTGIPRIVAVSQPSTRRLTELISARAAGVICVALLQGELLLARGLSTAVGEALSEGSVNAWLPAFAVLFGFLGSAAGLMRNCASRVRRSGRNGPR